MWDCVLFLCSIGSFELVIGIEEEMKSFDFNIEGDGADWTGESLVTSGRFTKLYEPFSVNFSFYSRAEVEKLSVKEITSADTFDSLGHALPEGLYDPLLGPTSVSDGPCKTCGLPAAQCPGHLGHIKLSVPVYNPALFTTLFRLLGLKCFNCHQFRMKGSLVREFQVRLMLLEANLLSLSKRFQEELNTFHCNSSRADSKKEEQKYSSVEEILVAYESKATRASYSMEVSEAFRVDRFSSPRDSKAKRSNMHIHCRTEWLETVKEFYSKIPTKKCNNCGAVARKLKRDGYSKIFLMPLSSVDARVQAGSGHSRKFRNAFGTEGNMEESSSSEDEEEEKERGDSESDSTAEGKRANEVYNDGVKPSRSRKFLHPLEVKEQMKRLWKAEKKFVLRIWGKALISAVSASGKLP